MVMNVIILMLAVTLCYTITSLSDNYAVSEARFTGTEFTRTENIMYCNDGCGTCLYCTFRKREKDSVPPNYEKEQERGTDGICSLLHHFLTDKTLSVFSYFSIDFPCI